MFIKPATFFFIFNLINLGILNHFLITVMKIIGFMFAIKQEKSKLRTALNGALLILVFKTMKM
ncbi:hypothetical protein DC888_27160 [Vibrio parahaemolyticus]|nr:hypothetical protein [Vibrio parahaemolyticus]